MTDVQLYLTAGLPVLAVLTTLTVSLLQVSAIREDVRNIRDEVRTSRSELRGEMGNIREDIREIRSDIKLLTGKVYELMSQK